ncbi:Ger(x)C family spore germination protein [Neobacillus drentensis]|uniref:Ger(x)C family spore germination protein n=1 Tax=Neobacillus drentensis TaxID=220684 RepID=UPI00300018D3
MKSNNKVKRKHMKSNINMVLAIGIIFSIIVSKQVQDTLLNKLSVVSAIGIDKSKGGYIASLQIYNPASNSKEGASETGAYTYSAKGRTIPEAMERIENKLARPIFLDNTEVAVIGEELAKSEGISSISDYFMRESNLPANIRFVISKGVSANKLLQIFTPVQKISGSRLEEMLIRKRLSWGKLSDVTSNHIREKAVQNRTELTIPYIRINGSFSKGTSKQNIEKATPETILSIDGLAVFQDQKLSYFLSSEESNLYALTHAKIKKTSIITKCQRQKGYVTWKEVRSKPVIQIKDKKGIPSFLLQLQLTGKLSDVSCKIDTSNTKNIASLQHEAEHDLEQQINRLITKTQNKKTDINGFGEVMYRKQPNRWNRSKKDWNSIYSTVKIQTDVRVKVLDVGDISS